ncbi:MAG: TonB-dependent receptor plug domain-containing protein [Oligoflexus sp.]
MKPKKSAASKPSIHRIYYNVRLVICLALLYQPIAYSQGDTSETESTSSEVIQITGSRIKSIDIEESIPITVFTREDIDQSGYVTVADFLRHAIPGSSMSTENETLTQVAGSASFAGRDLAADYTLVLINGRRQANNAIAESFVDINLIPMAAVERIEYLTHGASAVYGSDAVAGVLNIITRKFYEGVSVSSRIGQASRGDGTESSYQILGGASSARGNVIIAIDAFKREPVMARDRPLIQSSIAPDGTDLRSTIGLPGYIIRANNEVEPFPNCPPELINESGYCLFDVAPYYQAIPKSERQNIFATIDYQITSGLELYAEARHSKSNTFVVNGPSPGALVLSGASPLNPYPGEDIRVVRRFLDFGERQTKSINEVNSKTVGLRGSFTTDLNWTLEGSSHQLRNLQNGISGHINSLAATQAFNDGSLNPFVFNSFDEENELAAYERISSNTFRRGFSTLENYQLILNGSSYVDQLNREMSYAFGLEMREESFEDRSDELSKDGYILGAASSDGSGSRRNRAAFLELGFPVTANSEAKLAVRHDQIDQDQESTTYQLAYAYKPNAWLKLRASLATGFKAPNMHSLFLGTSFGVQTAFDRQSCGSENTPCELNVITGGNPDLRPEKSRSYQLGAVTQITESLDLKLDYWNIEIKDKIDSLSIQNILNNPGRFAELIRRDPNGRLNIDGAYVRTNLQNLTMENSAGIEAQLTYADQTNFGLISSSLYLNRLVLSKSQDTAVDPLCDFSGNQKGVDGRLVLGWSKKAWGSTATFRHFGKRITYSGGRTPGSCDYVNPESKFIVDSHTEMDVSLRYRLFPATDMSFGINSVTNNSPAFDRNQNWPWFDRGRYSNIGRFFYFQLAHEFQ